MNRNAIDKSDHVAAESSDLRHTNPWLASYRGAARNGASEARWAMRSSRPAARSVRLWAGVLVAVLLMIAIASTENVEAEATGAQMGSLR